MAKKLNDSRPESEEPLKVCVQLNIDEEDSKAGIKVHELETFLSEVSSLKNLDVKGLMVIPKPRNSLEEPVSYTHLTLPTIYSV